jgi:hypothetical protein
VAKARCWPLRESKPLAGSDGRGAHSLLDILRIEERLLRDEPLKGQEESVRCYLVPNEGGKQSGFVWRGREKLAEPTVSDR